MTTQTDPRSTDSGRIADAARNVAEQAEQTVEAKASSTMDQVSGAVVGVARAIRSASEDLRQEQPKLASAADTAAEQVDRFAEYLEQHEPREVFDAVQDAARRQPAVLIAGGIALGLLAGRLLRTTVPASSNPRDASWYGVGGPSGGSDRSRPGAMGNGGSVRSSDLGAAKTSIVASTRVVQPGSPVDTGISDDAERR